MRELTLALFLLSSASAGLADAREDCEKKSGEVAIKACTQRIRENPRNAIAYNNRGLAYHAIGGYDHAIADYTKAIEINSRYADPYYNRGLAYEKKADTQRAIADYRSARPLDPNAQHIKDALKRLGVER